MNIRFGDMAYAGPVVIDNINGENIVRIGDFTERRISKPRPFFPLAGWSI